MSEPQNPLRQPRPASGALLGPALFSLGRLADNGIQYLLLRDHGAIPAGLIGVPAALDGDYSKVLLGLYSLSSLRQVYWAVVMNENNLPPGMAVGIVLFNTFFNTVCTFMAVWWGPSVTLSSPLLWTGVGLFTTGILLEMVSEEQRKSFKRQPKNKGKPFTGGLNRIVQHPNYLGYTLWRTGILLTTGSLPATAIGFLFNTGTFLGASIPELQAHNIKKYGEEYKLYAKRTPKLFPFLI